MKKLPANIFSVAIILALAFLPQFISYAMNTLFQHAEIKNNGFAVNGPIAVKFLYYKTKDGQKVGEPVFTSEQEIFPLVLGYSIPFRHGEGITVRDKNFIGQGLDVIYYVEVIVDPSPFP